VGFVIRWKCNLFINFSFKILNLISLLLLAQTI